MFCPKCHTELEDTTNYCKRCGTKVNSKRKTSWSSFSSSKTFGRMNVKKTIEDDTKEILKKNEHISIEDHNETHDTQFNYSKNYSNVQKANNDNHQDQYIYSQQYSNTNKQQVTSDKDYIDAFIGTDIKKFEIPISVPAAIFGPFYYFYRKLWTKAVILSIIYLASYQYLEEGTGMALRFIITITLFSSFNKNYIKEVNRRVMIIKKQNQNSTSDKILEECKRQGGHLTIVQTLGIAFIYFIIVTIISINNIVEVEQQTISEKVENGILTYEISNDTTIKTNYSNYQRFIKEKENGICTLTVLNTITNKTDKEYITDLAYNSYPTYKQSPIQDVEINNIQWKNIKLKEYNTEKDIYILKTPNDNRIYELNFSSTDNDCEKEKQYVLNTLKVKEENN